jgi:hypothetical protein
MYHCLRTNDSRSSQQRDTTRNRGAGASGPAENTIPLGGEDSSRGTWHMQKHACTSSPLRPTFVCDINDISGYAPWRLFFFCLHLDQNTPGYYVRRAPSGSSGR